MTKLEELHQEADDYNVEIIYQRFRGRFKGLYCDGIIALDERLNHTEETGILAEELGHYHTSSGDILDQSNWLNRKQERLARIWAYHRLIPVNKILEAHDCGYTNIYEIADYLEVSEDFLQEAVNYYMK